MSAHLTRRRFAALAAAAAATPLAAQGVSARADVAAMEHDLVLFEAKAALTAEPRTLLQASYLIATLSAAYLVTREPRYSSRTAVLLTTWLITPGTRVATPAALDALTSPVDILTLVPLAEMARASTLLVDALPPETLAALNASLTAILAWLGSARIAQLARDSSDHRASAWLLLAAALARSQRDTVALEAIRHRFRTPTLRHQIDALGRFPQEMASPNPFRDTLFNFDLLCGACQLLDSPFDQLWTYELPDGPGMRSVAAFVYPFLNDPSLWPGVSDAEHFREVPRRRPGLLFAGRAFNRPEYVELWRSLPAEVPAALAASVPIRQPLLWTTRAAHGL